jgi:hypothetical protein
MSYTYTNRKRSTYYLCQANTKTGKTRYFFIREPSIAIPVDEIPAGYQVEESVNGIVSLVRTRPQLILPEELVNVEAVLKKHPRGHQYRAAIKRNQIIIYESQGAELAGILAQMGWTTPTGLEQEFMEYHAQFSPIMRFSLSGIEDRTFIPQRWCFRGSVDDWIDIGSPDKIDLLAEELIPALGTDDFYELY